MAGSTSGLAVFVAAFQRHRGIIVPLAFVSLLIVILIPLPSWLMDVLIAGNISLGVVILMATIYAEEPLELSVFPSLLLATTLFRLVLNVASTRLILTADGASGEAAAGKIISAFGEFVAGNSVAVGTIIFLIIVIVQFVVITKGATRISEVAARFTLDAMPGKQMAIDADLNAGVIDDKEAKYRRDRVAQEADFFGAMDGASKFVRGDAIAGLLITGINIVGGFTIGVLQRGLDASQAAEMFTRLTIGDGLASQLPSFVIAIAAALVVTRSGSKAQLGQEMTGQLIAQPTALLITAGFLGLLSVTPLPTVPLLATSLFLGAIVFFSTRSERAAREAESAAPPSMQKPPAPSPESLLKVDALEIEVGYGLVSLVDQSKQDNLLDRISGIRRQLAADLGFILPSVRIRDNMQLPTNQYRIKIRGSEIAIGETRPHQLLAMDSGITTGEINGELTTEPAFGLQAWWIDPALRQRADTMNYTVVDPTSVLATHFGEVVKRHAEELLTREEVVSLLDQLKEKVPKLVDEVVPEIVKPGDIQKVMQRLLREGVSVRDLETILETLADWAPKTADLDVLAEYARNALRRTICRQVASPDADGRERIVCATLDPALEDRVNAHIDRSSGSTSVNMPAPLAEQLAGQILDALSALSEAGHPPVVLASPQVRAVVRQLLEHKLPGVTVLGYNEVVPEVGVEALAHVTLPSGEVSAA